MAGTLRWNLMLGLFTFIIIFILSFSNNIWLTTILHSLYGFAAVFLMTFAFRSILGSLGGLSDMRDAASPQEEASFKGTGFEAVTPEDDQALKQLLAKGESSALGDSPSFTALRHGKLKSVEAADPEELANAVRRQLSEDKGW